MSSEQQSCVLLKSASVKNFTYTLELILKICFSLQVGISATTPSEFISQARSILTQQNELESLAQDLQMEIEELEVKKQELVRSRSFN